MLALLLLALAVWAALAILGFLIKGGLVLTITAIILFVVTSALGLLHRNSTPRQ